MPEAVSRPEPLEGILGTCRYKADLEEPGLLAVISLVEAFHGYRKSRVNP